jgi:hypothetical protein
MCDEISITHNSIRDDNACLCVSTESEIIKFIIEQLKPQIGDRLFINRTAFGWSAEKQTCILTK